MAMRDHLYVYKIQKILWGVTLNDKLDCIKLLDVITVCHIANKDDAHIYKLQRSQYYVNVRWRPCSDG